jgi:hypothetical protein
VLRDEFVEGLFPFPTRRASAQATDP